MVAIVDIVSRHGLLIKACHRNQPNKGNYKLELYKLLLHCNIYLKQLYISNKMECFSYKGGCGGVGICISRHLKEELALVTDERLQVISNTMLM